MSAGVQYGLPHVYNPDEVAIMARALTFAKGSLDPQNFLYPTFFFYVLFAWVGIYLAFVWVTGRVESIGALQRLLFTDPSGIYTAGRTLGVLVVHVVVDQREVVQQLHRGRDGRRVACDCPAAGRRRGP